MYSDKVEVQSIHTLDTPNQPISSSKTKPQALLDSSQSISEHDVVSENINFGPVLEDSFEFESSLSITLINLLIFLISSYIQMKGKNITLQEICAFRN